MSALDLIDEAAVAVTVKQLGLRWHYAEQTGSTNADALQLHGQFGQPLVVVSEAQSAGRGRRGRQWESPFAKNIYCTIGVEKQLPAEQLGLLSLVVGVALCETLQRAGIDAIKIKWPNDLLHDYQKLGGILIESRPLDDGGYFLAIGFGLNVAMSEDELTAIGQPATSVEQILQAPASRSRILIDAIASVVAAIANFKPSSIDRLTERFASLDAYYGKPVELVTATSRITGINRGIAANGQLQLETGQGIESFAAAEISLRAPDA
ncbi:MAG: BirA family biotin operon repressor/biotin-[acetyl-CoA-carboxylase] ligase [Gammaproteobacteria bacterium]|jgi:BirA family biotin operon repressor/biotin-[acetyl-CoA-carboxylase] ligase